MCAWPFFITYSFPFPLYTVSSVSSVRVEVETIAVLLSFSISKALRSATSSYEPTHEDFLKDQEAKKKQEKKMQAIAKPTTISTPDELW